MGILGGQAIFRRVGWLGTAAASRRSDSAQPMAPSAAAADGKTTILVYRDRIGVPSEVPFLRRLYSGFDRLTPVWAGWYRERDADLIAAQKLVLGQAGPTRPVQRFLFKQFGRVPAGLDLAALRPRLIHAHFGRGGALALPIARRLGIPLAVTYHGGDATKETHYRRRLVPTIYQRRLPELLRHAALIHCVSDHIRDTLLERGFPGEKLRVIRYGIEPAGRGPSEPPPAHPYVLFAGRFVEKKGATHLLEAMRILASRGAAIELALIGDGPLAGDLRKQARPLAKANFLGWLPNEEVRRWMRGALAVCVPSVTAGTGDQEGLPNVVLEALAAGAPVIASRHGGITEVIEHGRSGLIVEPSDPRQLADAVASVLRDPALRRRIAEAGQKVAEERFSALAQSRALEDAFLSLIAPMS